VTAGDVGRHDSKKKSGAQTHGANVGWCRVMVRGAVTEPPARTVWYGQAHIASARASITAYRQQRKDASGDIERHPAAPEQANGAVAA